jgi:hypothetical protein
MLLEESNSTIASCFHPEQLTSGCGENKVEALDVDQNVSVSLISSLQSPAVEDGESAHQLQSLQSEQERLAYTQSLNEVALLEQQLDRSLVEIFQNQVNVTQLRINTIHSLLKLKAASSDEKMEKV